jgi:2-polyprenyl-3-methyl-5-hydroxy-6-metoxy-1,4-benzoquinol methylase
VFAIKGTAPVEIPKTQEERLREEAEFADSEYAPMLGDTHISARMLAKYQHPRQMWDWRQRAARLLGNVEGKALLDYGCGQGEEAAYFAVLRARVTAIDISKTGISVARERAKANNLDIDFHVMSCTPTDFTGESFDIVHGMGILHHVGLAEGLEEARRLLRPDGMAVFLEPLGSSPLVEGMKRRIHVAADRRLGLIPVTSGEENLRLSDVRRETATWAYRRIYPYRLTYRARKLFLPKLFWDWSLRFDRILLTAIPPLQHFAGAAVIHLKK